VTAPLSAGEAAARADALIERRRLEQARALVAGALAQSPRDRELLYRAALIDHLEGASEDALATLRSLLAQDPAHVAGRWLLSLVLQDAEQLAEAEGILLGLLRDHPQSAHLLGAYAMLMLRTLHLEKAGRLAAEGLRIDPEDEACLFARAVCEITHSNGASEGALAQLLQSHPDDAGVVRLLVAALAQRGDSRAALRLARELLRAQPDSEEYLDLVRNLRFATHWSLLPLWPILRWGWAASAVLWFGGLVVANSLRRGSPVAAGVFLCLWLAYVLYSWIWPPLLRRRMLRD
jgi:tetratricopeptide (TPR) repeat protein